MTKRIEKITLDGDVASPAEWNRRVRAWARNGFLFALALYALSTGLASLR